MRNFYWICSFNVQHPKLRVMLEKMKLFAMSDSLVELRIRSKHYLSLSEAIQHAGSDVEKKIQGIYGEGHHVIKQFMMMNPDMTVGLIDSNSGWDRDCAASIYFVDAETLEEGEEDDGGEPMIPKTWMFKYEIFFFNDKVDVIKNGEQLFMPQLSPESNFTSTYH